MEKDSVIYKGSVDVQNANQQELLRRAENAITKEVFTRPRVVSEEELRATGEIKLSSSSYETRRLIYSLQIKLKNDGYKYRIDSVYVIHRLRGERKLTKQSVEDLFKGMDISGNVAIATERQLNEIDMDLEQLIALINRDMHSAK